jgi:hypothetical protein
MAFADDIGKQTASRRGHARLEPCLERQAGEQVLVVFQKVGEAKRAGPFLAAHPPCGQQAAESAVPRAGHRVDDHRRRVDELEPGPDQQLDPVFLRGRMRPDDAGQRVLIRDRERPVAEPRGPRDQLIGMRSPDQEAVVRPADQLGVSRTGGRGGLRVSRARRRCPSGVIRVWR